MTRFGIQSAVVKKMLDIFLRAVGLVLRPMDILELKLSVCHFGSPEAKLQGKTQR